jgi:hypothetical protein
VSKINQGQEFLIRRGLFGFKDGCQTLFLLVSQIEGYVDCPCSVSQGIAWE